MADGRDIDWVPAAGEAAARTDPKRTAGTVAGAFRSDAHAVVIGIDRYADAKIRDLRYARADAEAVYAVLTDPALGRFSPENVTLLLDEDATQRQIRRAFGQQLIRRAGKDDVVYVYYAGHGAPVINPAAHAGDGLEKYLVPHDAELDDLWTTGVSMDDDIRRAFGRLPARQVLFFIDSCYSGGAGGRTFDHPAYGHRAALTDEFLERLAGKGRLIVTACDVNEVSLEASDIGHGLFTHYLIEGLKGAADTDQDGLVTMDELYDYLHRNVMEHAQRLGGSMEPLKKGTVQGRVYLTQYETDARRRARRLHEEAQVQFEAGDLDEAGRLWKEALAHDPDHADARQGLAAVEQRLLEEKKRREAEARARLEALRKKKRVLLAHYRSGALPVKDFDHAMVLIGRHADTLNEQENEIRHFLELLTDGQISVAVYLESLRLLKMEAGLIEAREPPPEATPAVPDRPAAGEPLQQEPSGVIEESLLEPEIEAEETTLREDEEVRPEMRPPLPEPAQPVSGDGDAEATDAAVLEAPGASQLPEASRAQMGSTLALDETSVKWKWGLASAVGGAMSAAVAVPAIAPSLANVWNLSWYDFPVAVPVVVASGLLGASVMQGLALRKYGLQVGWWIYASLLGAVVAVLISWSPSSLVLTGGLVGIVFSAPQALVSRKEIGVAQAGWWVFISMMVGSGFGSMVEPLSGGSSDVLVVLLTGCVLVQVLVLRRQFYRAGWWLAGSFTASIAVAIFVYDVDLDFYRYAGVLHGATIGAVAGLVQWQVLGGEHRYAGWGVALYTVALACTGAVFPYVVSEEVGVLGLALAGVGVVQWLVLRRQGEQAGWAVLAGGAAAALMIFWPHVMPESQGYVVVGARAGTGCGLIQWMFLRTKFAGAERWVLATMVAGAVAGLLFTMFYLR